MLVVKDLCKSYKGAGKDGAVVNALDHVSCVFPETGMVFLLGKSGSGKSTLLNMIGGLDIPDSGEIEIKGRNSKDFSASDFDSYRNTYIGFIFQEYNILNEFNVEQNISLALQLQGKPNDKKAVDEILEQVDLKGLGKRKPNTLSGGQKQRVAIARALIKSPEIIMADEPSGALDSKTGKQVFETLKKLSKTKLVIVVSHDQDFAEIYGDRIIELSDGKIISDITKVSSKAEEISENIQRVNPHTIAIKDTANLTEKDVKVLLKTLKEQNGEAIISSGDHDLKAVKEAIRVRSDNSSDSFEDTKEINVKEYDGSKTKFIRSHLPMSRAFKMGASGLKIKIGRLIFTCLLIVISLVFFGLASSLMLFRPAFAVTQALANSDRQSEIIEKYQVLKDNYIEENVITGEAKVYDSAQVLESTRFGVQEIKDLNKNNSDLNFAGIHTYQESSISLSQYTLATAYYSNVISGFIEADSDYISKNGFTFDWGTYPTNGDEIAISTYLYEYIKAASSDIYDVSARITSYQDFATKKVRITVSSYETMVFTVTGVIKTGTIPEKYEELRKADTSLTPLELDKLSNQFSEFIYHTFYNSVFVNSDFYTKHVADFTPRSYGYINPYSTCGFAYDQTTSVYNYNVDRDNYLSVYLADTAELADNIALMDKNGNAITNYVAPKDDEVYVVYENDDYDASLKKYASRVDIIMNYHDTYGIGEDYPSDEEETNIAEAASRIASNGAYAVYYDSYRYGFDYKEDFATVKAFIDKYYPEAARIGESEFYGLCYIKGYERISETSPEPFTTDYAEVFTDGNLEKLSSLEIVLTNDRENENYAANYSAGLVLKTLVNYVSSSDADYTATTALKAKYDGLELLNSDEIAQVTEISRRHMGDSNLSYHGDQEVDTSFTLINKYFFYKNMVGQTGELKVIGYVMSNFPILSRSFVTNNMHCDDPYYYSYLTSDYVTPEDARFDTIITKTNYSRSQVNLFLKDSGTYKYDMTNKSYHDMTLLLMLVGELKNIFLVLGIVFGVFAALMLLNFISVSITAKTKDIGILRAVGARGSDLFKIFFSESGLVTTICLVLSSIFAALICGALNRTLSESAIIIQVFDFGILNILIMLAGSVAIAILGTLIPVLLAARKPPVESIRTL